VLIEDASGFRGEADALCTPASEHELTELLRSASAQRIPVTIVGARTGVAGGCVPDSGGWAVSLERFRRLEVTAGSVTAGAGVLLRDVQSAAARTGQFYGPDPTENSSSIGGNIATNASGSRSFRYGDTRASVLRLRVALLDGSVADLSRGEPPPFEVPDLPRPSTTKFSAGFDLRFGMDFLDLFIGSEGVLGVVTEATLRLLPLPDSILSGVVFFASDAAALDAVGEWREIPKLRMLEYMDAGSLALLRSKSFETPAANAALLIESEGGDEEVEAWVDRLEATGALAEESWFGTTPADRERFRVFRHALPEAVNDTVRRRGFLKMGTDFAVPVKNSREMMAHYRDVLEREFPGAYVIFGHIGDAHVHVNLLPRDQAAVERGRAVIREFAETVVSMGGVVAAEHGLGKRKRDFLALQWSPEQIEAMRSLKRRFDPDWLLGRGTLFPPA
jgi:FAD/FMN-containing dehydrogenase